MDSVDVFLRLAPVMQSGKRSSNLRNCSVPVAYKLSSGTKRHKVQEAGKVLRSLIIRCRIQPVLIASNQECNQISKH